MGCNTSFPLAPFESVLACPIRNGLTKPKKVRGTGVKMISMGQLFAYDRIRSVNMDRVPVTDRELESSSLELDDLLFARQSLVAEGAGKCSIVKGLTESTVFESHLIRARINRKIADPDFIYYYFKSPQGREQVQGIVEQVAAAGIRGRDLIKLPIPVPEMTIQTAVAKVLMSIDDKIDLNTRTNGYLAA